jgi:Peptidase M16 inactive domain
MLAVYGDFNTDEMKARIEKLFADWTVQQPQVPEFPKVGPAPKGGTYLAVKTDVTQTFFGMGELGGEYRDKDYPALEIMGDILGGGFQSRLFERVRTKMGNAYDISASWGANYDHPGIFEIAGSTKSLSTVATMKAIREEVDRIRSTEVTDAELRTAKDTALNSLVFAFDTKAKTLSRMLTYEYYGYPKDFMQQYQKGLQAVTRADVLRVAKEHLDPSKFVLIAVGNPQDFGTPLDALGSPVTAIDLTIPQPKTEAAPITPASLEKGKQLLQRAQQAVGGADRLAAIKDSTQVWQYQVTSPQGSMALKETDQWLGPRYLRQQTEMPGRKLTLFTDGKTGWIAAAEGSAGLGGPQLTQAKSELFRTYFPFLLSDRIEGRRVNAIGDDTVEISDVSGNMAQLVIDSATGLPSKVLYRNDAVQGPSVPVQEDLSDFREEGGIKMPHAVTVFQAGEKFADAKSLEIRLNAGLKLEELRKRP